MAACLRYQPMGCDTDEDGNVVDPDSCFVCGLGEVAHHRRFTLKQIDLPLPDPDGAHATFKRLVAAVSDEIAIAMEQDIARVVLGWYAEHDRYPEFVWFERPPVTFTPDSDLTSFTISKCHASDIAPIEQDDRMISLYRTGILNEDPKSLSLFLEAAEKVLKEA